MSTDTTNPQPGDEGDDVAIRPPYNGRDENGNLIPPDDTIATIDGPATSPTNRPTHESCILNDGTIIDEFVYTDDYPQGWTYWSLTPCGPVPTVAVAVAAPPVPAELPATGTNADIAAIGAVVLVVGALCVTIRRLGRRYQPERS